MVYAQSRNINGENAPRPVVTEEKPSNKSDSTNEAKIKGKKKSKQEPVKDSGNYKGGQPPQGGRLGQGFEHTD